MIRPALLLLLSLLTACAGSPVTLSPDRQPRAAQLAVPFVAQTDNFCGPAALAAVLGHLSIDADLATLGRQVYSPQRDGSLTVEMAAAPRRYGLVSYPLAPQLDVLLAEIDAGNPVLVLQNLGLRIWPQWHYSVVTGYDLSQSDILLHNGYEANYRASLKTFAATWARADHWARVIVPPERVPASAEPLPWLLAANALEEIGQRAAARRAYQAATEKWPEESSAWFALANATQFDGEPALAVGLYLQTLRLAPDNAIAWNNMAFALHAVGCDALARRAVGAARGLIPEDPRFADSEAELMAMPAPADKCEDHVTAAQQQALQLMLAMPQRLHP